MSVAPSARPAAPRAGAQGLVRAALIRVSGKATIVEHIRYALNHWDGLTRFLDDGRIELDTNIVERSIRLFAGHDQGAENWACIASPIETCKLCGVGLPSTE